MNDNRKKLKPADTSVDTALAFQMQVEDEEETIDLLELLFRWVASWKLILGSAILCAAAALVCTMMFISPKYEATSTIYVLSNSSSVVNMADLQLGSALTGDYTKVFDMWEVHQQVIENLSLKYTYKQMKSMLSVKNAAGTRMLDITVISSSPQEAADMANEYAQVAAQYISDNMSMDKPSIMSVALVPTNPISPSKTKNTILGFILGFAAACAFVTVRMLMDDRFKTSEDILKYTGMTTLAVVPLEESVSRAKRPARRKASK